MLGRSQAVNSYVISNLIDGTDGKFHVGKSCHGEDESSHVPFRNGESSELIHREE